MMNKTEIFRKIGGIISELTEQYQYLSDNFENMNELELELFVANSKFLTDHAEILKKLNKTDKPNLKTSQETASVLSSLKEEMKIENTDGEEELKFDFERKPLEEIYDREFSEEEQEIINRKLAHTTSTEEKEVSFEAELPGENQPEVLKVEPQVEVPAPKAENSEVRSVPTLNEVISSQRKANSISSSLTQQPISDLKTGINLNDKLLFVKNLFNGYSLAYTEAIEILNRFDSFEAADSFLKTNYAAKNNWAANSSTVEKFYEILHRRFSK